MKRILIATHNPAKLREYKIIFSQLFPKTGIDLVSLSDLNITEKIEETGKTYQENAILKVKFYSSLSDTPVLADDAGLEVDVLGGWPGIRSRRAAGQGASDEERIKLLLEKLKGVPLKKRKACYKVVIALADGKRIKTFEGEREGFITEGNQKEIWKGFPYDSVFYLPERKKALVELGPKGKAKFSHRRIALEKAIPFLEEVFELRNDEKICKWYRVCPLKRFYEEGRLNKKWIENYCFRKGEDCQRLEMEEKGIFHPDNMLPDGEIDKNL